MKRLLICSLLLNVLLVGAFAFGLRRLGGWAYFWQRLRHTESGNYANRKHLFAQLPEQAGALILLGDSHIEQCEWHEWQLDTTRPVLNRGIVGDGVDGLLARLDADVLRHRPAQVVVCIGTNDLLFGRRAEDIAARYREIVQRIRQGAPQAGLVLVSVLPVNNTVKKSGLEKAQVLALNEHIRRIAGEWSIPYLDLHAALADGDGNLSEKFTADGVHLNGAGYAVWQHNLAPILSEHQ